MYKEMERSRNVFKTGNRVFSALCDSFRHYEIFLKFSFRNSGPPAPAPYNYSAAGSLFCRRIIFTPLDIFLPSRKEFLVGFEPVQKDCRKPYFCDSAMLRGCGKV